MEYFIRMCVCGGGGLRKERNKKTIINSNKPTTYRYFGVFLFLKIILSCYYETN